MANVWDADIELSIEAARRLIETQFPSLRPASLVLLGNGWDNTAYTVNGRFVFRFPRRRVAAAWLESECQILPLIGPDLPLPVPLPEFLGRPDAGYPYPFAGYRHIAGVTACSISWTDAQRAAAAPALARFLAALHGLPVDQETRAWAPGDTIQRADLGKRLMLIRQHLEELDRLPEGIERANVLSIAQRLSGTPPWSGRPCWVHGDLYARHVLVDSRHLPCGVIDWGDVHLGDPALDLSIAFGFLPASARQSFRSGYGPVDDATWDRARFRALYYGVVLIGYGGKAADGTIEAAGEYSLRSAMVG